MLSERSAEIARSLIEANLRCHELVLASIELFSATTVADELGQLAVVYRKNVAELNDLLELDGFDVEQTSISQNPEQVDQPLQSLLQAANQLRREYAAGVNASRELSERLPRQFARTEIAHSKLKGVRKQIERRG